MIPEGINHVALHRIDGILLACLAIIKIVIIGVKDCRRRAFQGPASDCLGDAKFGLERPTIGTDVYKFITVIDTERCGKLEGEANNGILPVILELLEGKGRSTRKINS
jgi:hypothetical protein